MPVPIDFDYCLESIPNLKYLSFLRNSLSKSAFFTIFIGINSDATISVVPTELPKILPFSNSKTLPLKINALPTNFYQRQLPPKAELVFPPQIPFRF